MKRMRKDIEISDLIYKFFFEAKPQKARMSYWRWCLETEEPEIIHGTDANHLYEGVTGYVMWIQVYL
ncbi:MAG: hypothetical protein ACLTZT_06570 [Butyricimonas faecalis]